MQMKNGPVLDGPKISNIFFSSVNKAANGQELFQHQLWF